MWQYPQESLSILHSHFHGLMLRFCDPQAGNGVWYPISFLSIGPNPNPNYPNEEHEILKCDLGNGATGRLQLWQELGHMQTSEWSCVANPIFTAANVDGGRDVRYDLKQTLSRHPHKEVHVFVAWIDANDANSNQMNDGDILGSLKIHILCPARRNRPIE